MNLRGFINSIRVWRWFWIFFCAVIGATLAYQVSALYWWLFSKITGDSSLIYVTWNIHVGCFVAFLSIAWASSYFRPRLNHLKNFRRFPPMLTAVPLGGLILIAHELVWIRSDVTCALAGLWPFLAYAIAIVVWCVWTRTEPSPALTNDDSSPVLQIKDLLDLDEERVLAWLQDQGPIQAAAEDLLSMSQMAARIRRHAGSARPGLNGGGKLQTVAIQGPYGAGKSSVVNLAFATNLPGANPRVIFVSTSCWGFESSARAREHILEACVEKLAEEVDCAFLRPLPGRFVESIKEAEGWWKSLAVLLPEDNSPAAQLNKLSPVLEALNAYLVIAIEDVDRNGQDFDQAQMESMLHQLRQVERLSFVLTVGPSNQTAYYHKVAEHVELLEALPPDVVLALVDKVRNRLRKDDYIDPEDLRANKNDNRPKSLLADAITLSRGQSVLGERIDAWQMGIGALLRTPRMLKGTLATFVEKWEQLRGEVDIDELLMFLALRNGAPKAASFLLSNLDAIHLLGEVDSQVRGSGKSPQQQLINDLKERWQKTMAGGVQFDERAAASVLCELLPNVGAVVGHNSAVSMRRNPVQSVRPRGNPYLNRIVSGEVESGSIRDQDVFKLLKQAADKEDGAVLLARATILDARFGPRIEFFEEKLELLSQSRRLVVISTILSQLRERDGSCAILDEKNFSGLWIWVPPEGGNTDELKGWYLSEIRASLPRHLFLATGLFAQANEHLNIQNEIREKVPRLFEEKLAGLSAQEFAGSLNPGAPHTLSRLIKIGINSRAGAPNLFAWMGPSIMAAIKQRPDVLVEEVFWAFGEFDRGDRGNRTYEFNGSRMSEVFGDNVRDVYSILAEYVHPANTEPALHRNFEVVKDAAKMKLQ